MTSNGHDFLYSFFMTTTLSFFYDNQINHGNRAGFNLNKQKRKVSFGQNVYFSPYWNTAVPAEDPGPLSLLGWVSITKDGNVLWSGTSMKSPINLPLQVAAVHHFQPEMKHHGGWSPMLT